MPAPIVQLKALIVLVVVASERPQRSQFNSAQRRALSSGLQRRSTTEVGPGVPPAQQAAKDQAAKGRHLLEVRQGMKGLILCMFG